MNRLPKEFFRNDAVTVARRLLGKVIVRTFADGSVARYRITETEAYLGEEDKACHASKGRTPRTEIMYADGGCIPQGRRRREARDTVRQPKPSAPSVTHA